MPVLIFCLLLFLGGCSGPKHIEAPPDEQPDVVEESAPELQTSGALTLIESWPVGTSLDHASIPDAAETWIGLIDGAQSSLEFEHFYGATAEGSALEDVMAAVQRAAERGVEVHFIFDQKFYAREPVVPDRLAAMPGVEIRILDLSEVTDGVQHAKFFVVDQQTLVVGSQNFDWRSLSHIVELGFVTDEPMLVDVGSAVFAHDSVLASGQEPVTLAPVSGPVQLEYAPVLTGAEPGTLLAWPAVSPQSMAPKGTWDLPMLLERINSATTRVRVQVMSYGIKNYDKTEFRELDDALRRASVRGVSVELMVADWSKKARSIGALQELQKFDNIEVRLVTIPQHDTFIPYARVIHAKYMTVDGEWSWVGTSNWSGDYFYKSRNMGLVLQGESLAADLDQYFDDLWTGEYAETVDPEATYEPPKISMVDMATR